MAITQGHLAHRAELCFSQKEHRGLNGIPVLNGGVTMHCPLQLALRGMSLGMNLMASQSW